MPEHRQSRLSGVERGRIGHIADRLGIRAGKHHRSFGHPCATPALQPSSNTSACSSHLLGQGLQRWSQAGLFTIALGTTGAVRQAQLAAAVAGAAYAGCGAFGAEPRWEER